jgi:hypothetical protein
MCIAITHILPFGHQNEVLTIFFSESKPQTTSETEVPTTIAIVASP